MVKLCGFSCLCPWTSGKSVREYSLVLSRSGAYTWWWRLFGWVVRAGRSATAFPALGPGPRRLRRRGPGPPASLGRPSGAAGPLCKRGAFGSALGRLWSSFAWPRAKGRPPAGAPSPPAWSPFAWWLRCWLQCSLHLCSLLSPPPASARPVVR